jgi:lon-related putative ATP-dependent protease
MSDVRTTTHLLPEALRWSCDGSQLPGEDTRSVPPVEGTIGQDRALKALKVGLELHAPGYNVFVSGATGTGRTTTVKRILKALAPTRPVPKDRAFVFNFEDSECPTFLRLPAGRARELARAMTEFSLLLNQHLPRLFEDKDFTEKRDDIMSNHGGFERGLLTALSEKVQEEGFAVVQVQVGPFQRPEIAPVHEGKPVPIDSIRAAMEQGAVPEEVGKELLAKYEAFSDELLDILTQIRENSRTMASEIQGLARQIAHVLIDGHLTDLRRRFPGEDKIQAFVDAVEKDILEEIIVPPNPAEATADNAAWREHIGSHVARYTVNVLLDNSRLSGCPVVTENYPTFTNLFGAIERIPIGPGIWGSDHRHVKAGSLLKADGGYLILSARDVLAEPAVWHFLKQALRSRRLEIQAPPSPLMSPAMLKPEPIKIDVKIVMIGEPGLYDALFAADPDFRKIFKVKADFDASMKRGKDSLHHFISVVAKICKEDSLLPLDGGALGVCAEMAVRDAGRRNRISVRFNEVADVVREAHFWATEDGSEVVTAEHVRKSIEERADRYGLMEERLQSMMEQDVLMIATDGSRVGQVNGLSVYQIGYHSFGKPTRITAATSSGGVGIINVEREARLSGGIYDKGVLIISGWMRRMFAQDRPMSLTASLCFEQSYSGVDGDSASVAEICALLSELSELPLDNSFAVTGSINQHGEVQPVGGVNEKIEGYFDLCQSVGLTGRQGCIIPGRNVMDLMLRPDIQTAVAEGKFHVHAVGRAEEALEILTGVTPGERDEDGTFAEGTIYAAVEAKLDHYAARAEDGSSEMSPQLLAAERGSAAGSTPETTVNP